MGLEETAAIRAMELRQMSNLRECKGVDPLADAVQSLETLYGVAGNELRVDDAVGP